MRRLLLLGFPFAAVLACSPRSDELERRQQRLDERPSRVEARAERTTREIKERLADRAGTQAANRAEIASQLDPDPQQDQQKVSELRQSEQAISRDSASELRDEPRAGARQIVGTLRAASESGVIVQTEQGHDLTLRTDAQTELSVLGEAVTFAEFVEPGAEVRASYTSGPNGAYAESIEVIRSASEILE